jgi:hypothetical protein
VNPLGDDVGNENVTLVNINPGAVDIKGWAIVDKEKKKEFIGDKALQPGEFWTFIYFSPLF